MTYDSAMFTFNPYGQYWREMCKIVTVKLLSNHQVEMLKHVRISEIRSAIVDILAVGPEPVDMKQWFSVISLNTIVKLVAGKSLREFYQGEEYNHCAKAMLQIQFFEFAGAFFPADALPFLRWFDIGGYKKNMKKVAEQVDHVLQRWLEDHKNRTSAKEAQEKRDFMDVLLGIFETEQVMPSKFETDTVIKATCMLMILAAADTTTLTLTWALSLLLNNKDVLKKTQAELDAVVGKERLVDESDLKDLVYLQSDLKPSNFNPQRFLTACKDYDFRGQNYEFMPFGSGRRMCPGISFAQPTFQFTLANLLHGFKIFTPSNEPVDMTEGSGLTIQKVTPVKVILTQRLPHHLYN